MVTKFEVTLQLFGKDFFTPESETVLGVFKTLEAAVEAGERVVENDVRFAFTVEPVQKGKK